MHQKSSSSVAPESISQPLLSSHGSERSIARFRGLFLALLGAAVVFALIGDHDFVYQLIVKEGGFFEAGSALLWLAAAGVSLIAAAADSSRRVNWVMAAVVFSALGIRELDLPSRMFAGSPTSLRFYLRPGHSAPQKILAAAIVLAIAMSVLGLIYRNRDVFRRWVRSTQARYDGVIVLALMAGSVAFDKMPHVYKALGVAEVPRFEIMAMEEISEFGLAVFVIGLTATLWRRAFSRSRLAEVSRN